MPATILDGSKIAQEIRSEAAAEVKTMAAAGVRPGLAVVLVGHNPASEIYVRGKVKACEEVGVYSEKLTPPEAATTAELLALIEKRLAGNTVAEWTARLQDAGVLVAEVKDYAALVADPLAAESALLRSVGADHGVASPVRLEHTEQRALRPRQELDGADVRFGGQ